MHALRRVARHERVQGRRSDALSFLADLALVHLSEECGAVAVAVSHALRARACAHALAAGAPADQSARARHFARAINVLPAVHGHAIRAFSAKSAPVV
jgi:hypothetical protein